MKPLKLSMTAFGPYKHTECVDFNELEQNKLFVISGNTGAGKTTIFDGICFALYGSASGTDREDNKMLRSDFADDDTHTAIELEFELHGRYYRILRQLGHVKAGNKSKTGERYEFYEKVDGKEVPCVDRQIVSEIDKKVEAIIGLTQDQFKQIVMLPQGEFRKLLTSQTENKEAILRRLFKTESYNQINQLLRDKKNQVDQGFKQAQQQRDTYIQNISATLPVREESKLFQVLAEPYYNVNQVIAGLETESRYYAEKIELDSQKYDDAYKAHDKKQTDYHQAKSLNERFTELDQKKGDLEKLEAQKEEYTNREKRLEEAERASHLEVYERQVTDWKKEEQAKRQVLIRAEASSNATAGELKQAQETYEKEANKKDEREATGKKLEQLKGYLPTVKELDERKNKLERLVVNGKEAAHKLDKVKKDVQQKTEGANVLEKQISQMDEAVGQLPEKQQELTETREQAKVVRDFINYRSELSQLEKDFQQKKEAFLKAQKEYKQNEEAWLNNQASILAEHLHDGDPCPVCGSVDHPNKAVSLGETVTREQLDGLKKHLDDKDRLYKEADANYKSKHNQVTEKEQELAQFEIQPADAQSVKEQLFEKGSRLNNEVETLKKQRDELKGKKEQLEKAKNELKQLETQHKNLEQEYQEQKLEYRSSKAVYDDILTKTPEEVRVLAELEKQISETDTRKQQLDKSWEVAQETLQKKKEAETKATSDLEHARKQLNETKEKLENAIKQFDRELTKANFASEEAYHQAKMPEEKRQEWKEAIRQFKEDLSSKQQSVNDLQDALKDKERVDLSAMEEQLQALKAAYETALKTLEDSREYLKKAETFKTDILNSHEEVAKREKELATITDLHDVLRGQNDRKISFERYLQIEYLERIIDAANSRLKRLSNGQFYLMRSDRQESHGRQSGLALDVYDAYTGQTRDVKTLSGGEKFNASLCLALGMSDVIQSFQGNISIDTMFIDEGFGSLDEESLNKSIDTLIELQQSGRMIGVISHVQELKTMFPAILQVSKTKEGHSRTSFLVK
ncbi:AAA family ATPase [Virgibacillus kekensis]|uniref:Nuclease SbcCD subunit C n=1 Tax=Virgibacillus kekensis TaxID=202261 RepID=A0ABV9DMZ2_9BACI